MNTNNHYYSVGRITELVPYEKTVIEYRAPTDASIKLYGEMLDAARKSIVCTIEPNSNSLGIRAVVFRDHQWCDTICRYILTLNGEKIEGEVKIQDTELSKAEDVRLQVLRKIYTVAAEHIANELCKVIYNDIKKGSPIL